MDNFKAKKFFFFLKKNLEIILLKSYSQNEIKIKHSTYFDLIFRLKILSLIQPQFKF